MTLERDIAFEHRVTAEAAAEVRAHASRLNAFADRRAHPGPVRLAGGRDLELEAAEELADARNYLVWRLEQLADPKHADSLSTHHRRQRIRRVLALTALAFDQLDHGLRLEQA